MYVYIQSKELNVNVSKDWLCSCNNIKMHTILHRINSNIVTNVIYFKERSNELFFLLILALFSKEITELVKQNILTSKACFEKLRET